VAAQVGCGLLVLQANPAAAQAGGADSVDSKFLQVGAVRVHYLDFGGRGIPILFMHSGDLSASTYSDFAPRFTDLHRVIAMTERGVPPSEGARGSQMQRGGDAIALLDSLGIERAVLIGNSSPTEVMLYLAEHYPHRVAGLVFLAGAPEPQLTGADDPLRIQENGNASDLKRPRHGS
jgi:pimeloyl-ACP methyl ester carboxylesterase